MLPSRVAAYLHGTLFRLRGIQSLWIAREHGLFAARGSGAMTVEELWCGVASNGCGEFRCAAHQGSGVRLLRSGYRNAQPSSMLG